MIIDQYFQAVAQLQDNIRAGQLPAIRQAADILAATVAQGGSVHLFDTGHIVDSELLNRAGGFTFYRRFRYDLTVSSDARPRPQRTAKEKTGCQEGLAALALQKGQVLPGDAMIIGSVSGKTVNVIDLALACRDMGVKVIALTSVTYSSQVPSMHSCGKHLYELADCVIDNCAPYGDAMLKVNGLDSPFIPASGLAAVYILWALSAQLADQLLARGIQPGVLRSVNYEPNRQYNERLQKQYQEKGY